MTRKGLLFTITSVLVALASCNRTVSSLPQATSKPMRPQKYEPILRKHGANRMGHLLLLKPLQDNHLCPRPQTHA